LQTKLKIIPFLFFAVLLGISSIGDIFSSQNNILEIKNIIINNIPTNKIEVFPSDEISISFEIKFLNSEKYKNNSNQIILMIGEQKVSCVHNKKLQVENSEFITIKQNIESPLNSGNFNLYALLLQENSCESAILSTKNPIEKVKLAKINVINKIDDWVLNDKLNQSFLNPPSNNKNFQPYSLNKIMSSPMVHLSSNFESIGFSVGGAKDIQNFRENINNGYLPLPTDITHEGLFYDYYFDTNLKNECEDLFCPSYNLMTSPDPLSGKLDYFMSVGLNSNLTEANFERKPLNLVIVLDISGSMGSPFNKYYYDGINRKSQEESKKSKMVVATKSVVSLLKHLKPTDKFGLVLFNNNAQLAKPLSLVSHTNMSAISDHILEIHQGGGTNMSAGIIEGTNQFDKIENLNSGEFENRIIFLTDAMPNTGRTGEDDLLSITKENASNGIFSTFIGVGVDFNSQLIEHISKIKGANYYSVHNDDEFKNRMDDEFEFMVTPLVFNLQLTLDSKGFEIEKVYGSPEANEASGDIMKVNTLFPSAVNDEETRGGIILLKLKKTGDNPTITLRASYENRQGEFSVNEKDIVFNENINSISNGIRKGILLTRYVNLLQNWILDERQHQFKLPWRDNDINEKGCLPPNENDLLGKWERKSKPLIVSKNYQLPLKYFMEYFKIEMIELKDDDLSKELETLQKIIQFKS
jgi:Ca-activated chloride channel homolog